MKSPWPARENSSAGGEKLGSFYFQDFSAIVQAVVRVFISSDACIDIGASESYALSDNFFKRMNQ